MEEAVDMQKGYLKISFIIFPVLLLLSYVFSRYLVHQSMKPVARVLTFQEMFSSNITHELNSPLTAIKGNLEVILKKDRTLPEYRDTIKFALKDINGIIDLLNNLYLLAASDFKPLDLYKEEADIKQLIDEALDTYEPLIYTRNIKLDYSVQPETYCTCDVSLLRRTLANLIDNAVKYSPENGSIGITAFNDEKNCMLTISNTCSGIKREELDDFFKPFYRGKHNVNKDVKGGGLGLYIVKYIVQSHGGKIFTRLDEGVLSIILKLPKDSDEEGK